MPHLFIAAPHKSSGKTTITLGLCAALRDAGHRVQPFKKGPDYIDPMWLSLAAGRPCRNLDFNTMSDAEIGATFGRHASRADIAIIEGNMGLYDSLDVEGRHSNAGLAALLQAPVVLVVDVKGMTRSAVALIRGFIDFDPTIRIGGVILNNVAGQRHEERLREVISHYLPNLPLVGAVHRSRELGIDERHLGLIPSNEAVDQADALLQRITARIARQVDLEALLRLAAEAPGVRDTTAEKPLAPSGEPVRIGIARDEAFGFYYPDDLERLEASGAELVPFDTLHDRQLPSVDGLFIGGGFPEKRLQQLAANVAMREAIRAAIEGGLPVYAECGGLMYLCRSVRWGDEKGEMVGVVPADAVMHRQPVGRGYIQLEETGLGPWQAGRPRATFNAHEFHYSSLENVASGLTYAYKVLRGSGIDGQHDGFVYRNLLASYAHLRDVGAYPWTRHFLEFVRHCKHRAAATG